MPAAAPAQSEPRSVPGCPSDDALLSYIPGVLGDEDAAVVLAHLQSCSSCQSRVTVLQKRLSSEGPGRADAAPTAGRHSDATPGGDQVAGQALSSDPAAPTLAYVPKRRTVPEQIGQYQVLGPIGRGGMGVVYKGYHPRLQRHVAIKLLHGLHLADNTAIIRLQREQAAAGRVEHENIIYAFDAGEQDGVDYLVMEYVEGVDLARLVAGSGPLSVADSCEIARQVALGLGHIEACGLVHRDIKPSNLMLSTQGVVKILDLGLARLRQGPIDEEEATHSGFLLGTADYMSPEQIDTPRDADVRSDLYSLGCALFKLLVGHAPFSDKEHSSYSQKIDAHRREPPPPIRTLRADVPEGLDQLLSRLLAKDPADRPQHPDDVAAVLAPLAAGADLRALVREAASATAAEPSPVIASDKPSAIDGSTHPQGRTPTPRKVVTPSYRGRWTMTLAGVLGSAALALLLIVGTRNWWLGSAGSVSQPAEGDVAPPATQDLLANFQRLPLNAAHEGQTSYYDSAARTLHLGARDKQLVAIGELVPSEGSISFDLDFTDDLGDAGIIFGRRIEIRDGQRATVAHLIFLSTFASGSEAPQFRLWRMQALIRPDANTPHAFVGRYNELTLNHQARTFQFEFRFSPEGLTSIRLNGAEYLPLLYSQIPGLKYNPEDLWGEWGFYNDGSTMRISNLRVSTSHSKGGGD